MQVKVLGAERRRRWNYDDKVRLVEEALQAGETVSGVARRHGVAASLLFTWRRQARNGRLGGEAVAARSRSGSIYIRKCPGSRGTSVSPPQEQTSSACPGMSVWCHEATCGTLGKVGSTIVVLTSIRKFC
jgi:transposase-like protein